MARYILRRLTYSVVSLLLLSLTIFLFVRVTGDPTTLLVEPGASQEEFLVGISRARESMAAYAVASSELTDPELGPGRRQLEDELHELRAAAERPGSEGPALEASLVLILFFSVYLEWLPSSGSGTALHLIMPAFALGWYFAAAHMRLTRSSMLEVLGSEYIKLARLKGLPESLVICKHAFKNALIPVLTLAGINLVIMINVAVVVETVFAWPGIGRLLYEGITFRDFPVVQAVVLLGGIMIVAVNLLIDILYAVIDPRIRLER